jgi:hypothetical protein
MMTGKETLSVMLTYKRPAGSQSEEEYINRFIAPLGVERDPFGNLYKIVGDENTDVLWSSHTDTVHRGEGRQIVDFDNGFFRLHKKSKATCLGADCAVGNWIMINMIMAEVPGLYVFHHGEEIGCVGSSAIAKKAPDFLKGINMAIAFDRRGTGSIITHQGSRTCSDAFGNSLAAQLEGFKLDPTGILTDTKMYAGIVPECTNLSVGYFDEHRSTERLDFSHAMRLRDMMLKIDTSKLVIERDPKITSLPKKYVSTHEPIDMGDFEETMADFLWAYPDDAAEALQAIGVSFDELKDKTLEIRTKRLMRIASAN